MIFLTVGTQFPFDRLTKSIDEIVSGSVVQEDIFGQIGDSLYQPRNFRAVAFMDKSEYDRHMREASCVIGHAGIGTITTALEYRRPLLVMPRLKRHGEVVNDHQVVLAKKFEQLSHILVAYDEQELPRKIKELKSFKPCERHVHRAEVAERIKRFLQELDKKA